MGGIKNIFTVNGINHLSTVDLICCMAYLFYFFWLWRVFSRRVILGNEVLTVIGWIKNTEITFNTIVDIQELFIAKRKYAERFSKYLPHLFITDGKSKVLLRSDFVKNYETLKQLIEEKVAIPIESNKIQKPDLEKILEVIP